MQKRVSPAVFFTDHDELLAIAHPDQPGVGPLAGNRPRLVGFAIDLFDVAIDRAQKKLSRIAKPAECFCKHFLRITCPLNLPQVKPFLGSVKL